MSLSEDSDAAMNETLRRRRLIIDSSSDSEGDQCGAARPNRDARRWFSRQAGHG